MIDMDLGHKFTSKFNLEIEMKEYLRPWKLTTLAFGLVLLIWGALYYKTADWNIAISLIMGLLAYATAPWVFQIFKYFQWRLFPVAFFMYWLTVDGSYYFYNTFLGGAISMDLRLANFFASSLMYVLCGWLWSIQGTFWGLIAELIAVFRRNKM
jgi:hypothetical protein